MHDLIQNNDELISTDNNEVVGIIKDLDPAKLPSIIKEQIKNYDGFIIEKVLMDQESFCATDFGNVKGTTYITLVIFIIAMLICGLQILFFFKFL